MRGSQSLAEEEEEEEEASIIGGLAGASIDTQVIGAKVGRRLRKL